MVDLSTTKDKCTKMLCLIAFLYNEDMIILEERTEMKCKPSTSNLLFFHSSILFFSQWSVNELTNQITHISNLILLGLLFKNENKVLPALKSYESTQNLYDFRDRMRGYLGLPR